MTKTLTDAALQLLRDFPGAEENARGGSPSVLGSFVSLAYGVSPGDAEHAIECALDVLDRERSAS